MSFRKALAAGSLAFVLAGCNITNQYYEDVEGVGKQIVADWKELPEVVNAEYEYRHGLDQGQVLYVDAIVRDESAKASVEQLEEIARRDYWRGTWQNVSVHVAVFSEVKPPVTGPTGPDNAISRKRIELDDPDALAQKYGPRPTKK
ncbi:hypothetical protein [Lentzea aerocolonigenes]|uniref:hypothetical protein n=1 Tax=Lentzea aerocolonigenes TaxID=68170 RepID=UPI0012DC176D|nr:hypothetical protein [Lentzea aerocolonigenes]MCP2249866.1 hypothetical protein [Lentzea aerocolonigenes]